MQPLVDELKQHLVEVWSHFNQAIIDEAIDEWRKRLLACARMKGHHFEPLMLIERRLNHGNFCCKNVNVLKFTV